MGVLPLLGRLILLHGRFAAPPHTHPLGNSSKPIIKGYMEKRLKNRLILLKTFTNVEFHGENNEINRFDENLITVALWEFFWLNVFNPLILE